MKMRHAALKGAFFFALALIATGVTPGLFAGTYTEELHQVLPLASDGRVSLDNVNGGIKIAVWDRPEVKLDAVKRSKVKEHLAEVKIEIDSKPDRLVVHTQYPKGSSSWSGRKSAQNTTSVEYSLLVPAGVRLDSISSVNGDIEIKGIKGAVKSSTVNGAVSVAGAAANLDLSTVNGHVKAGLASLNGVQKVHLSTVNGALDLSLPADANADVSASTVNGSIGGDVKASKGGPGGRSVNTKLGQGGTKVNASTVNGGIRIRLLKAED